MKLARALKFRAFQMRNETYGSRSTEQKAEVVNGEVNVLGRVTYEGSEVLAFVKMVS